MATCKPTISASHPGTNYISVSHGIGTCPTPRKVANRHVTSLPKSHYEYPCAPYVLRNYPEMHSLLQPDQDPTGYGPAGPVPPPASPPSLLRCGPFGLGAGASSGDRRTTRCRSGPGETSAAKMPSHTHRVVGCHRAAPPASLITRHLPFLPLQPSQQQSIGHHPVGC